MSSTNSTSITIGSAKNRIHIAARVNDIIIDVMPAPNARPLASALCHDVTVAEAQTIVDALVSSIAEVKANQRVPDIKLPDLDFADYGFGATSAPVGANVRVDGVMLKLVNWVDFKGWEVREAVRYGMAQSAVPMGYLSTFQGVADENTYRVRDGKGWEQRDIARIDDALKALIVHDREARV